MIYFRWSRSQLHSNSERGVVGMSWRKTISNNLGGIRENRTKAKHRPSHNNKRIKVRPTAPQFTRAKSHEDIIPLCAWWRCGSVQKAVFLAFSPWDGTSINYLRNFERPSEDDLFRGRYDSYPSQQIHLMGNIEYSGNGVLKSVASIGYTPPFSRHIRVMLKRTMKQPILASSLIGPAPRVPNYDTQTAEYARFLRFPFFISTYFNITTWMTDVPFSHLSG